MQALPPNLSMIYLVLRFAASKLFTFAAIFIVSILLIRSEKGINVMSVMSQVNGDIVSQFTGGCIGQFIGGGKAGWGKR